MTDKESAAGKAEPRMDQSTWLRRNGWNLGVLLALVLAGAGGMRFIGKLEERTNAAHEKLRRLDSQLTALNLKLDEKIGGLSRRLEDQLAALNDARENAIAEIRSAVSVAEDPVVFSNGTLSSGYNMGVSTSSGLANWVTVENEMLCMDYPSGQEWGVAFITVGRPSPPPRAAKDFSQYRSLLLEARGMRGGESVMVGLKDNADPDDGSETKVPLSGLTTNWQRYEIRLTRLRTADLTGLYVVTEFVFETSPAGVCIRKIEFLR